MSIGKLHKLWNCLLCNLLIDLVDKVQQPVEAADPVEGVPCVSLDCDLSITREKMECVNKLLTICK